MSRRENVPFGDFPNNCNKVEYTGDGVSVGRCWHHLDNGKCPRHGQILEVQKTEKRWQKIWEVCPDFKRGERGLFPVWSMLFLPIIMPLVYIIYYYAFRKKVDKE